MHYNIVFVVVEAGARYVCEEKLCSGLRNLDAQCSVIYADAECRRTGWNVRGCKDACAGAGVGIALVCDRCGVVRIRTSAR